MLGFVMCFLCVCFEKLGFKIFNLIYNIFFFDRVVIFDKIDCFINGKLIVLVCYLMGGLVVCVYFEVNLL